MSIIDGTFITAIFMGLSSVITAIGFIIHGKLKGGKAQRPVDTDDTYVTHGECKSHRCALEKRIDELGPALNRIFNKLSENDRKSEERSIQMHRRLDPIVERVAANSAKIEMFEDLAHQATVGGKK